MDTTRASLIGRVRDPKDTGAWREFFALYYPLLKKYARSRGLSREEAEDVAQMCMVTLSRRMPTFVYSRKKGRFRDYLRRIANNAVNKLLAKPRMQRAHTSVMKALPDKGVDNTALWERLWLRRHLAYCMRRVRGGFHTKTFEAFKLVVLDGWPVTKVCAALGMNSNQVYLSKMRVLRRIRKEMVALIGDEE